MAVLDVVGPLRPRLVANVSLMFADLPLVDRLARVREAGIGRVEMWWPFSSPEPHPREVGALYRVLDSAGVELVAMNLYGGNTLLGDRGVLSLPGYGQALVGSARAAVEVSRATGCALFNVPYGAGAGNAQEARQRAVHRLTAIGIELAKVSGTALLEPLTALPTGSGLWYAADAVAVLEELRERRGVSNVAYLLDTHHAVNNGEDPVRLAAKHAQWLGHVQLADVPGRGRPGTGQIDFGAVLSALATAGYQGLLSLEYVTGAPMEESRELVAALTGHSD